jgi:hypothetical protein
MSWQFRLAGYPLAFDARGYGLMAAATLTAILLGGLSVLALPSSIWSVGVAAAVTLASFALALRMLRPFAPDERRAIEMLLGRRIVLL